MSTPNKAKPSTPNPKSTSPASSRPWFEQKRFAFPVIGITLAVILSSALIGSEPNPNNQTNNESSSTNTAEDANSSDSQIVEPSPSSTPGGASFAPGKVGFSSSAGSQPAIASETENQKRARLDAKTYYETSWFSRVGLIEQLEFDGFAATDATYGVDSLGVDWGVEAVGMADAAISSDWFSRQGLIDHFVYQGFTASEATTATDALGIDWFEEAAGMALDYLEYDFYTYEELVDQLIYDGFTEEEADYGASEAEA